MSLNSKYLIQMCNYVTSSIKTDSSSIGFKAMSPISSARKDDWTTSHLSGGGGPGRVSCTSGATPGSRPGGHPASAEQLLVTSSILQLRCSSYAQYFTS
ncbi:hypothetical protein PUN28_011254 [Cardiocondyla obscurior]|uniref:Uncharacterized protein n=1 Tax=Cardiocondyla obscurior TaxID=286306 RepID=A0AAW2FQC1_9HYME